MQNILMMGKRSGHHPIPQEEINEILLREAKSGKKVVRLKGGDPFVFGRGAEEIELLLKEGVPYEIVPGITSAISVAAYAGIPVTHRNMASSLHIVTAHKKAGGIAEKEFESLGSYGRNACVFNGCDFTSGSDRGTSESGDESEYTISSA